MSGPDFISQLTGLIYNRWSLWGSESALVWLKQVWSVMPFKTKRVFYLPAGSDNGSCVNVEKEVKWNLFYKQRKVSGDVDEWDSLWCSQLYWTVFNPPASISESCKLTRVLQVFHLFSCSITCWTFQQNMFF